MKFRRSDGVEFEADAGSASAKMMTKDGGFELLEDDGKVDFPAAEIGTEPIQTKAKSKKKNAAADIAKTGDASANQSETAEKGKVE